MANNITQFHCPTCSTCIACGGNRHNATIANNNTDIIFPLNDAESSFTTNEISMYNTKYFLKKQHNGYGLTYNGYDVKDTDALYGLRNCTGIFEVYDDQRNLKNVFRMLNEKDYPKIYTKEKCSGFFKK
jgi:hypothetical protein